MKIFLDSCVILSRLPRELMLEGARCNVFELFYSQSVEEECMHVAKRKGLEQDIAAAFVDLHLTAHRIDDYDDLPGFWLPDENDRHVALAAIFAKADVIATENLRDFPNAALKEYGMLARSPDQILLPYVIENRLKLDGYGKSDLKRAKLYRVAKSLS